ncbi:MAG: DUF4340 domain-containing protein [Acetobacteraceae bacterium]
MRPASAILLFLLGLASLGAGWYWGLAREPQVASRLAHARPAFPGLAGRLAAARQVEITANGAVLRLDQRGHSWGLAGHGHYPIRPAVLHALFAGLAGLRLRAPLTADPRLLPRLGLPAPGAAKGPGTRVLLRDQAGHLLAALILGRSRTPTGGGLPGTIFVRFPGRPQAWLAEGTVRASAEPAAWLDRTLFTIPPAAIARVEIARGGDLLQFVRVSKKGAGKKGLVMRAPADHPALDAGRVRNIATALQEVTFSDVLPAARAPGRLVGTAVFTTTKGLSVTARVRRAGAYLWVGFAAAGTGAKALAARLKGWVFRLGAWREVELVPSLAQLRSIKVVTPPPAPSPPATAPTPAAPAAP